MTTDNTTEKKRFFNDDLESSMETTKTFNTSFDNSKSFLFNPTQELPNENENQITDKESHHEDNNVSIVIDSEVEDEKEDLDQNQDLNNHNNDGDEMNIIKSDDEEDEIQILEETKIGPRESFAHSISDIIPGIDEKSINELYNKFKHLIDPLSHAISYYFENHSSNSSINRPKSSPNKTKVLQRLPSSPIPIISPPKRKSPSFNEISHKRIKKDISWKRFIGALQVTAMATRPTIRPLKYGSKLKISKKGDFISPSKLFDSKGRQKKMMSSYVKIVDVQQDREIGKVPEEIARILYPFLDTDEVVFETTLVYCEDKRLSIGDSFVLELDCYLTSVLFEDEESELSSSQNYKQTSTFHNFGSTDSNKDQDMENKARRVALISLFKNLRLRPILKDQEEKLLKRQHENNDLDGEHIIDLDDDESFKQLMSQDYEENNDPKYNTEESMNLNQLQTFYNSAQSYEAIKNLPETVPPSDLVKMNLRPYQKQGLTWMLRREHEYSKTALCDIAEADSNMMNPLWKQFKWPKDRSWADTNIEDHSVPKQDNIFFYGNLHTGNFSLEKPILKTMIKGGILSDEMGLGKTISALSLVLMAPHDSNYANKKLFRTESSDVSMLSQPNEINKKPYASKTTLIIVPMSLLNQWHSEFESINNSPDLRAEIYYGGNVSSLKTLLTKTKNPPTVVLTTYGIVQNEWSKLFRQNENNVDEAIATSSGLFSVEFYRIIIDEGHTIRNRSTITSKSVMDLNSKCKWVLTGTPIINRLDDLFSIIKFLRLEPWCNISFWKTFVSIPFENQEFKQAFDVVNSIMQPVLLRRTKQMRGANGAPLVELPPKEVIIKRLKFNKTQATVYKHFLDIAETSIKSGLARGDLLKKYSTILVNILRLRQVCCDIGLLGTVDDNDEDISRNTQLLSSENEIKRLIKSSSDTADEYLDREVEKSLIGNLQEKFPTLESIKQQECSICTTEDIGISKMLLTECGHTFCENCLLEYVDYQKDKESELKCPLCRTDIAMNKLFVPIHNVTNDTIEIKRYQNIARPAKLAALIDNLQQLQDSSSGEQVIVFSQFSSYLDILEKGLKEVFPANKAEIYKFDGRLSLKERSVILKDFQEKDFSKQKILLLSLKAGGVGLNLTCASHAYMMDPWWSPSMEDQAIDRIHRIGQTNNVKVLRFIIEGSIEEKMLRIQERKRTIGEAMDADQEERRKRRIEEIKSLLE